LWGGHPETLAQGKERSVHGGGKVDINWSTTRLAEESPDFENLKGEKYPEETVVRMGGKRIAKEKRKKKRRTHSGRQQKEAKGGG